MNVMLSKTFFPQHPKAGEPTGFREKVKNGTKRHTCRCNYDYWKDRIAHLQERNGVLSLRQWGGKPYEKGSHMEKVLDAPASMVEIQRLVMHRTKDTESEVYVEGEDGVFAKATQYDYFAEVEGTPIDIATLAKNDGLSLEDFKAWFNPVFDEYAKQVQLTKDGEVIEPSELALTFAVIHFTTFRY